MALAPAPFGDAAWRIELPEGANRAAVLAALGGVAAVIDAVVCERHALVTFRPDAPPARAAVVAALERAMDRAAAARPSVEHVVRVRYDGADLADVARAAGLAPAEVVDLHTAPGYVVASIGFLPGFAYLGGLDPRLVVPRRSSPRPRVPALAVAIAGPYAGVYPFASPGGWSLLGTAVGFVPFSAATGAALALGDAVRFERIDP